MYVPVGWRFGSRGYLASCLTSDVRVRPVPPILSVGWVYTLILVEVGGVIYMYAFLHVYVYVCTCVCMYLYMYVHVYTCIGVYLYMCMYAPV